LVKSLVSLIAFSNGLSTIKIRLQLKSAFVILGFERTHNLKRDTSRVAQSTPIIAYLWPAMQPNGRSLKRLLRLRVIHYVVNVAQRAESQDLNPGMRPSCGGIQPDARWAD
jgi:hypothetical protein